jgi:multiple sugar transport system permease protein
MRMNAAIEAKAAGGRYWTWKRRRHAFIYAWLLFPLVFFIVTRIGPILFSFYVGFHDWEPLAAEKPFVGFGNYVELFQDPLFLQSIRNTFVYVLVGVPAQIAVGLAVALLLHSITRLRGLFRAIYFIPYITSVVAVVWVFRWMLMPNGVVNAVLLKLGLKPHLFLTSPTESIYLIIGVMVWQSIGFQSLIFVTGLENTPAAFREAAYIDGAGRWQALWHITLPLLRPVLLFSVVMASINFLQTFTQVLNMTDGGPLHTTETMVLYIYKMAFKQFKMGTASAATVILFFIIFAVSMLQLKLLDKKIEY